MNEEIDGLVMTAIKNHHEAMAFLEKVFAVAKPGSVFSEPVQSGDYTVITASEVGVSLGFGYGTGGGNSQQRTAVEDADTPDTVEDSGYGVGGGGGGYASGRPVAVISIGPEGVDVKPVVDETKIALALFTALGSMFLMFRKMK